MEKVLYEYSLNYENIFLSLIPLVVGVGFLTNSILKIRSKERSKAWDGFVESFFKFAGLIIGPLGICIFIMVILGISIEHRDYQEMLKSNEVYVVEGYVEKYHPMPYEGHDTEHFEIDGVYFEYSDYIIMNGYNISASHGGVITRNGQHLKIKYVTNEFGDLIENIILYIAETGESIPQNNINL
ncbi:MAG: hypothetical protein IJC79_01595 [Clostridia bacterium]|nr:hypothetical protein [Clostridia bacterium]